MRLLWCTDIHLDFALDAQRLAFYEQVDGANADLVVVTGDIANGTTTKYLTEMADAIRASVTFVLGNHDFYGGAPIAQVRAHAGKRFHARCDYLSAAPPIALNEHFALVGVDGWIDGRFGDWNKSDVWLSDYTDIADLRDVQTGPVLGPNLALALRKLLLLKKLQDLAQDEADALARKLREAQKTHANIVVATHVPPFVEASWYNKRPSDWNYLPHFTSKVVGDAIVQFVEEFPNVRVLVLCGHTHGEGVGQPHPRITTWTGHAEYRFPEVQTVLEIGDRIVPAKSMFHFV